MLNNIHLSANDRSKVSSRFESAFNKLKQKSEVLNIDGEFGKFKTKIDSKNVGRVLFNIPMEDTTFEKCKINPIDSSWLNSSPELRKFAATGIQGWQTPKEALKERQLNYLTTMSQLQNSNESDERLLFGKAERNNSQRSSIPRATAGSDGMKLRTFFESSVERSTLHNIIQQRIEQNKDYLLPLNDDNLYTNDKGFSKLREKFQPNTSSYSQESTRQMKGLAEDTGAGSSNSIISYYLNRQAEKRKGEMKGSSVGPIENIVTSNTLHNTGTNFSSIGGSHISQSQLKSGNESKKGSPVLCKASKPRHCSSPGDKQKNVNKIRLLIETLQNKDSLKGINVMSILGYGNSGSRNTSNQKKSSPGISGSRVSSAVGNVKLTKASKENLQCLLSKPQTPSSALIKTPVNKKPIEFIADHGRGNKPPRGTSDSSKNRRSRDSNDFIKNTPHGHNTTTDATLRSASPQAEKNTTSSFYQGPSYQSQEAPNLAPLAGENLPTAEDFFRESASDENYEALTFYDVVQPSLMEKVKSLSEGVPTRETIGQFKALSKMIVTLVTKLKQKQDVYDDIREYVDLCQQQTFSLFENIFLNDSAKTIASRILKLERWTVVSLFNVVLNSSKYAEIVSEKIFASMVLIYKLNQYFWIWMHRIQDKHSLDWGIELSDQLLALSAESHGMKFFEKIHETTQALLDQINEL